MTSPRSLQGRLLAWVLGVLTAVWLGAALGTWFDAQHEVDELLDSHLAQAASLLVAQQTHELDEGDDHFDVPALHRYAPRVAFQVWHEGRQVLRSSNAPAEPMSRTRRGFETLVIAGTSWRVFSAHSERGDVRVYVGEQTESRTRRGFETLVIAGTSWRVFSAHSERGDVQVYVGEQTESRSAIMLAVMRSMLWPLFIALPLLGLASWWSVRHGLAPLRRLGMAVAERKPQGFEAIMMSDAPTEMLPLITALNRLFERIAELLESERRFTSDAAHELRTPIAGIRAQAQVALGATQDRERAHALQATVQGCDHAVHLVDQLLTLSRLEAAPAKARNAVDLADITRRVLADLAPHALARQQTIELDARAASRVEGEPVLLGVLVRNLVDNAIRYSPPGATINVVVAREAEHTALVVEDSGPGLTSVQQQRLGERFFRVLGSGQSGSGLGWSIVRRIAAAHGASVDISTSKVLGGLSVRVSFMR